MTPALDVVSKQKSFLEDFDRHEGARFEIRALVTKRWTVIELSFTARQLSRPARDARLAQAQSEVDFHASLLATYQGVLLDAAPHIATQAVTVTGARFDREMSETLAPDLVQLETKLNEVPELRPWGPSTLTVNDVATSGWPTRQRSALLHRNGNSSRPSTCAGRLPRSSTSRFRASSPCSTLPAIDRCAPLPLGDLPSLQPSAAQFRCSLHRRAHERERQHHR